MRERVQSGSRVVMTGRYEANSRISKHDLWNKWEIFHSDRIESKKMEISSITRVGSVARYLPTNFLLFETVTIHRGSFTRSKYFLCVVFVVSLQA